ANYPSILRRPIRASDFDRLILYSQFTKTLYHKVNMGMSCVPVEIWNHSRLSAAFPHLESLHLSVTRWVAQKTIILSPFLRPTLRKVCFTAETSQLHSAFRNIARNQTLALKELEVTCLREIESLQVPARQAILSQGSLRRLRIFSLDDVTALAYTAKELPCLTHFDVGKLHSTPGSPSTHEDDKGASEPWFRSLVTLRASGSPAGVNNFMKTIGSEGLAEIKIDIEVSWREPIRPDALLSLHAFKAALIDLEVQIRGDFAWSHLEPVLELDQLQKFSLIYTASTISPQVNDAQLRQMTRAWPRLTSLRISDALKSPTITLQGLGYIASNSRNLRSLFVTFDGTSQLDPPYLPRDDPSPEQNKMELVDVLWSKYDPGDELRLTTSFFRRWWPHARIMASDMHKEEAKRWEEASA
ncbi:hypothetical protein FRC00_010684, partial [Tulasnella sp. 408]